MTAVTLGPNDLAPFATIDSAKATEMIADALGMAELVAPCISKPDFKYPAAAKAVLRGAILRWNDAGSGAITTKQAGPYQQVVDASVRRNNHLFWPSEIEQLQSMCRDENAGGAFAIDTAPSGRGSHSIWCSLGLGGDTCSCGIGVTAGQFPIWEPDV
ncbi:hypothetical protein [Williamsia serinedens]|uniref:Head-to-tail adaptor n=1 Tax=Williamsia serinedens TaxID=391736 RepID=A0ABT1H5Z6_9NOCA|nr:hypothetical protein [Williamsia serinedens]MCP2162664.1 hypothetical protein [Williamsia serinedens]